MIKVQAGKYNLDELYGNSFNIIGNNTAINIGGLNNLITIEIPPAKYVYGGHIVVDTRKSIYAFKAITIENNNNLADKLKSSHSYNEIETVTSLAKLRKYKQK